MQKILNEYLDLAGDAMSSLVGLGSNLLATRIDQYSQAGDEIAKTLRSNGGPQAADAAEALRTRARQLTQYLRECDGRRVWSDLQDTLNGRGWVAATAGLAAGVVVARMIRSSPPGRGFSTR